MKIVLSGVETNNKGAELMLYAILQEIERRHPQAQVYISQDRIKQGLSYVKTFLDFRYLPFEFIINKLHINGILRRLGLQKIECMDFVKADYFLDGSGFIFSDLCGLWSTTPEWWEKILKHQYNNRTKIVFLPQAFGPFRTEKTQKAITSVNKYAHVIFSREQVSYNYLKDSGLVDMKKVSKYTDFTSLVDGIFPSNCEHLKGGICIIPNMTMISSGKISYDNYVALLTEIALESKKSGHLVYLLNHEGPEDAELCHRCKESIGEKIEAVTNLNALEVKGLISSSYMVITSRFHGLASALNSCVPALSTSWSHKYEELYKDYGLDNYVLPLENREEALEKVKKMLAKQENQCIRALLDTQIPKIKAQTKEMWTSIWNL